MEEVRDRAFVATIAYAGVRGGESSVTPTTTDDRECAGVTSISIPER